MSTIKRRRQQTGANRRGARTRDRNRLTYVEYKINRDTIDALFSRITRVLVPTRRWFNRAGRLVYIGVERGLTPLAPRNVNGLLASVLEICLFVEREGRAPRFKRFGLLPNDLKAPFVDSPRVVSRFPQLRHYTRSPLFGADWHRIKTPGYHVASQVYYDGPTLPPAAGTTHLDELLSGFCWKTPSDRTNAVGVLVTGVTVLRWPGTHPLTVINANRTNLGKTLLGSTLGLILHGSVYLLGFHPDEAEFEKQIATGVDTGERVLLIDNVKPPRGTHEISSSVLERCVTAPFLRFRRLGTNQNIGRANDVLFVLTINKAKLNADLRRRCVPINLEFLGDPDGRTFAIEDLDAFARGHRLEILAELLGMVQRWIDAGRPMPPQSPTHSVSREWARIIDAVLQFNGYQGFLANLRDASHEFDADHEAVSEICAECHDQPRQTAQDWAGCLYERGLLHERLNDLAGCPKPARAQATIVGSMFSKCVGQQFSCAAGICQLRATSKGKTHIPTEYWFEQVLEGSAEGPESPPATPSDQPDERVH